MQDEISVLETSIKQDVTICGESIKGEFIQAIYNKGRVKWDTNKLEGLAVVYPDIMKLKSTGKPYVTLRMK